MTCLSNRHAWERRALRAHAYRLLPGAPCPRVLAHKAKPPEPMTPPTPANAPRPPRVKVRTAA